MKSILYTAVVVLLSVISTGCDALVAEINDEVYDCVVVSNETQPGLTVVSYTGLDKKTKTTEYSEKSKHQFLSMDWKTVNLEISLTNGKETLVNRVFIVRFNSQYQKGCKVVSVRFSNERGIYVES